MPFHTRTTIAIISTMMLSLGCASVRAPTWFRSATHATRKAFNDDDNLQLTPREREQRLADARVHYANGDRIFQAATQLPREQSSAEFAKAAKSFRKAVAAHPGSAIAQDAQFMLAESYFFADHLSSAEKAYGVLQKEFPNSRHNDRAAARQFSIAQYWIDTEKAGGSSVIPVNFVDKKRPWFDVDGHGIRVLDQIRFDDPTGKLSDDATMAAAVEHFRQEKWSEADEFLTDLRETFTDSEHLFNAHMLGIRTKMNMYAGPKYSQLVLEEADKLIQQTRTRFPDKMREAEVREVVAKASAEVGFLKAQRIAVRARYRERRGEYGAARLYYQELLADHSDTSFAEEARTRLALIGDLPALPEKQLAFLTKIFPEGKRAKPLVTSESTSMFR